MALLNGVGTVVGQLVSGERRANNVSTKRYLRNSMSATLVVLLVEGLAKVDFYVWIVDTILDPARTDPARTLQQIPYPARNLETRLSRSCHSPVPLFAISPSAMFLN